MDAQTIKKEKSEYTLRHCQVLTRHATTRLTSDTYNKIRQNYVKMDTIKTSMSETQNIKACRVNESQTVHIFVSYILAVILYFIFS